MTEKRYLVNDIVKFDYSEIWKKSNDELHTDTPLRNDEIIDLLNENEQLKQEIKELRQYLDWDKMELEELEDIDKNVIR